MNRGEVPGYEFEVPRGPRHASGPRHAIGHDPLRHLQRPQPEPPRPSMRRAGAGVLAVIIAVVVIAGGNGGGGAAPSALAAGFPPARAAGPAFTGNASRVILTAI